VESKDVVDNCPFCGGLNMPGVKSFRTSAIHLRMAHGLVCNHICNNTTHGDDETSSQTVVALFGIENQSKESSPITVYFGKGCSFTIGSD